MYCANPYLLLYLFMSELSLFVFVYKPTKRDVQTATVRKVGWGEIALSTAFICPGRKKMDLCCRGNDFGSSGVKVVVSQNDCLLFWLFFLKEILDDMANSSTLRLIEQKLI